MIGIKREREGNKLNWFLSFFIQKIKIGTLFILFIFAPIFVFPNTTYAVNSLIGSWNFSEGTGTTAANAGTGGSAVNGTLTNMANPATATSGWTASGKVGGGIIFDGTDDIINFGSDSSVDDLFTNDVTISFWMNPTSCTTSKFAGGKSNGAATGVYLYSSNGLCNPRIDVYHSTTRALYISAANSITANQWNLVTYVWHASTKTAQIYVNGVEVEYSAQTPGVGTYVTEATRNLTFGTWGAAGSSLFTGTLDEIKIYNYARTLTDIKTDAGYLTSSTSPVTVIKNMSNVTSLLLQMPGEADNNFAEFKLKNIGGNNWSIQGLKIFDLNGTHDPYVLNDNTSVWEYAYKLGIAGDPDSGSNWNYFGNGHGNESAISYALSVDSVDITSLPVSSVTQGSQIVVDQSRNALLPKDGTTQVGTVHLIHTLDSNGLLIDHTHTYQTGYELYNSYSAMLPTDHSTTTGINRSQIGNNAIYQIQNNNSAQDLNTITASSLQFSTNQPYAVRLALPSGGPDVAGDWSHDAGSEKIWFYDTAEYGKVYVNWVSGGYSARIPAAASQHKAQYQVIKNTLAPNGSDADNDLIANYYDIDIDGDGTLNGSDTDIDGDGLLNAVDPFPSGIGSEADIDGDGVPNAIDTNIDGDWFLNSNDGDIDGDGISNGQDTSASGVLDSTPAILSAGLPSGSQSSGTTQVTLSLTTNESATCKYGATASTAYASIATTFATTGGTTHSDTITGLSNGQSYNYHVRCIDGSSNVNTNDYTISFSIASPASGGSSGGGGFSPPAPITPNGGFTATTDITNSQNKTILRFGFGNDITNIAISDNINFIPAIYINATSTVEWTATTTKIVYIKYCNKYGRCSIPVLVQINAYIPTPIISNSYKFYKNLSYRMANSDVRELQKYLNVNGFVIAQSGAGSLGKEINYFGLLTYKSLIKFQEAHAVDILIPVGFTKGTGYFGPSTRAFVNK